MQRRLFIGGAALALIAGGSYIYSSQSQTSGPGLAGVNAQEAGDIDTSGVKEMALGAEDAPVTMIEYASYTCPHCASFHENVFGQLKADYIDTGKVRFVFREVYFDQFGLLASLIARCGGEERYFGISDLIFERQREWLDSNDPAQITENLRAIGRSAGLSNEQLDSCINDREHATAMIALYQQNATADDITGTPSFVINGQKYANMNYDDLREVLDEKIGG